MKTNHAGFLLRALADTVERLLFMLGLSFALYTISQSTTITQAFQGVVAYFVLFALPLAIFNLFIHSYFTARFGGNIGKLLTGLRVEDSNHKLLSFKRSLFRHTVGYAFSSILLFLGYFSIIKDPEKRGFHDKVVDSYVVVQKAFWPLALVILIGVLMAHAYLLSQAAAYAVGGPLKFEIMKLAGAYQESKEAKDGTLKENFGQKESSPSTGTSDSERQHVIFVNLNDSVTQAQVSSLADRVKTNPSVKMAQFLTKEQAIAAYETAAPGQSAPTVGITPVLIIYLNDIYNSEEILDEVNKEDFVQTAYPYSF